MTPAVLIAFLTVLCFAHMGVNAQTQIKIGVFLPNTTDFSASKSIWKALTLYAEEVNNSTLIQNATVVLSFKDTQFSKSLAVKDAVSYAKDYNVFATIGEFYSRNSIPSALALNQFKVLQCSGSSTNADLSNKTDYQYFFRTVASDNIQGVVLARYVKFMNWTQVAIITANDEYGLGLAQAFQEEASKLSVSILANVLYTPSSVDFNANILQLKGSGARIFLVFSHNDCGPQFPTCGPDLMLTAKKNGLIGRDYVWIGAESFYATMDMVRDTSVYGSEYRDAVNGMLASFPMENPRTQIANDTIAKFRQHYGSEPTPYTLFFRDCLATYVHGIVNLLQQNTSLTLAEILDRPNSNIDALSFVSGLAFEGATGTVAFDSNADRSGNYAIINNYNTTEKVVFVYNAITNVFEKLEVLRFYDGTSAVPSGLAAMYSIVVSWDDPGVAILVTLHTVMILVVINSTIVLYRERDSKIVKSLSLNLIYLIALGIILIYTSIFTSIGVPNEEQCLAQMWVPWIGFSIVISNLAVKVFRIYKIFDNPQMAQLNGLKDRNLLIVSSLLVSIEVLLLAIVTLTDPPRPVTTVVKSLSIQYTSCVQLRPMVLNWVVNVYNFILLAFVLFLAFKTRSVVSRYRESQWIGYTVQNVCISVIVLFPIINSTGSITTIFYIRTAFVFYAATVAYACLIGRIVFSIYTDRKKESFNLSHGKLTKDQSKNSHADPKLNMSAVLTATAAADQTLHIEIPVKEAGSLFGTWRNHLLIYFKSKNLLGIRDKRRPAYEPCALYDMSFARVMKSDQIDKCIEFVNASKTLLLQFPDKSTFGLWWDILKSNSQGVGSNASSSSNDMSRAKI